MCRKRGQRGQRSAARAEGILPPCRLTAWAALCALITFPTLLAAQTPEIDASRRRLDSIRVERQRLQGESQRLQGRVKDVGAELRNIEAQQRSTHTIINEIDRQIGGLNNQVDRVGAEAVLAQDNMVEAQAILERRLVDIYKRGAMYAWQVLLSAESFGDLISRYKYLYLTSRHDRALLTEVEDLRERVATRRNELLGLRTTLDRSRAERDAELNRYTNLANTSERQLRQLQRTGQDTERQLTQLERDEEDINRQITALIAAARRAGSTRPGTITTADIGQLDWPVDGRIVFNFGRDRQPDGVSRMGWSCGTTASESARPRVPPSASSPAARWSAFNGGAPMVCWYWSTTERNIIRSMPNLAKRRWPWATTCPRVRRLARLAAPTASTDRIFTSRSGERRGSLSIRPPGYALSRTRTPPPQPCRCVPVTAPSP